MDNIVVRIGNSVYYKVIHLAGNSVWGSRMSDLDMIIIEDNLFIKHSRNLFKNGV